MKVLYICNYKPGVGGISGQVEILQRKLHSEGHEAEIFNTKASLWKRLRMMPKLHSQAKEFDVMHIHCCSGWGFLPAVIGISVGKRLGKRIVLTYHGGGGETFFDNHPRLVRRYLLRTDVNIVLSGFLAKVFVQHGIPFKIIPNIIELNDKCFQERRIIRPDFICIRAHEELYNIPCILRALRTVQEVIPEASLVLVGDGSQHEELVQKVNDMGLHNVTFTGRVDNRMIYQYLDKADVMLSAPIVDNMPVSLIEAMNAGLLVLSSNVGGVPYMIDDGVNGLLFECNNDAELAEKMLWAMRHQVEVKGIVENARCRVKQYQWSNVKDQLYIAYGIRS